MKSMTCKELGGACDAVFSAETFDEMAELSKAHAMEMMQKQDEAHLIAMNEMQDLMKSPEEMMSWFEAKKTQFKELAED